MYIHAIIKFGNRKWMDEFQKGKIHFKQLKQFQDFEKNMIMQSAEINMRALIWFFRQHKTK